MITAIFVSEDGDSLAWTTDDSPDDLYLASNTTTVKLNGTPHPNAGKPFAVTADGAGADDGLALVWSADGVQIGDTVVRPALHLTVQPSSPDQLVYVSGDIGTGRRVVHLDRDVTAHQLTDEATDRDLVVLRALLNLAYRRLDDAERARERATDTAAGRSL